MMIETLVDTVMNSNLLAWHVRTTAALAVVVLGAVALRGIGARGRHRVLAWGLLAAVVVPTLAWLVPASWSLEIASISGEGASLPTVAAADLRVATPVAGAGGSAVALIGASQAPTLAPFDWAALALGVWLTGAGLALAGILAAFIGGVSLRRSARPTPDALQASFACWCRQRGVRARLLVSPRVFGPLVLGVWRPVVFLPVGAIDWSHARLRAVVLHELGHVAQRDHVWFPVVHILRGVLWFNPLAWLVARRFFAAAEFSADAAALAGGMSATEYAAQLLSLAQTPVPSHPLLAAAALGHVDVGTRIRRLLSAPTQTQLLGVRRVVPVVAGSVGALACIVLARPVVLQPAMPGMEGTVSAPEPTGWGPVALEATVPVPTDANRIGLRDGRLLAVAGGRSLRLDAPGGRVPENQRTGHLIDPLYEFLKTHGDASAPVVLTADANIPFSALVDALYSAGRAGISTGYMLEVDIGGQARALPLTPPRFPQENADRVSRVKWLVDQTGVTVSVDVHAPPYKLHNATEAHLRAHVLQLCQASALPLAQTFSALPDTSYGTLTAAMLAIGMPCGQERVIEAGS